MAEDKTFYITTPIYYVNGVPHVGSATTTLLCDALARYHRLRGEPTFFLTGTDEHAQKVADAAAKAGKTPQAFVDEVSQRFRECWQFLDITNDDFIRTSEPRHKAVVAEVFRRLQAQRRHLRRPVRGLVLGRRRDVLPRLGGRRTGAPWRPAPSSSGSRRTNYYFRLSAYGDRLLRSTSRHTRTFCSRTRAATKSWRSSRRACATSPSPGATPAGASPSPATRRRSSTSGSTPSSTT